jgi:hypothetical protein
MMRNSLSRRGDSNDVARLRMDCQDHKMLQEKWNSLDDRVDIVSAEDRHAYDDE